MAPEVMQAFSSEGFNFLGKTVLVPHSSGNVTQALGSSSSSRNATKAPGHQKVFRAFRFTPSGDVYAAKFIHDETALVNDLPPTLPAPSRKMTRHLAGSAAAAPAASSWAGLFQPLQRKLHRSRKVFSILGADGRKTCPAGPPAFPFTAVGELDFSVSNSPYICTATLIKPDKVITAAHCVYDLSTRAFVSGLTFSPGRYRTADGAVKDPYEVVPWKHATIFQQYPNSGENKADIAIVDLAEPIGEKAGVMGLKAGCNGKASQVLTTAGYPSDKPYGTCVESKCNVVISCNADATKHTCDTYLGQSGSPFWDDKMYVRGVHVRGMADHNEFTTISSFIVDKVANW